MSKQTICVVGNPNCGKTTLFNALTGAHQEVGNWPGVTVEKKVGHYSYNGEDIEIVDLPGIYSITPASTAGEDERVARDYILTNESSCVVNIVDASNLERNLYLTSQLIEMRVPMIVVVNMLDIAEAHHLKINLEALQEFLKCPVIGMVAARNKGVEELKGAISDFLKKPFVPPMTVKFDEKITHCAHAVEDQLAKLGVERPNWFAVQLMENAPGIADKLPAGAVDAVKPIVEPLNKEFDGDLDIAIADARYQFVAGIAEKAIKREGEVSATVTDKIDHVVLNRWLGLPIFLLVMYVMFLFTQNFGAAFIDFFDIFVGGVAVDGFGQLLESIGCPEWLKVILADGIGGGIQTVSTFIPVIFFLYFFLAILEDSGYMARAAFVMDRLMRALGLPGKAFVPLIVGFGCNVPAIMATRTIDRPADRITTIMMAPFMSCGARLPVYVLFATAFFPTNGQNLVFALYLIGIVAAVFTGFILKKFVLTGETSAFVMEIPPYHMPTFKGVMIRTWDRLKGFVMRAGKVIVVIVACLQFLNSWGVDGSFGNADSDKSVLSKIGQTIVPVFQPMGVQEENWPAAVGIFTGILAKEAVVGTMNSLYETMAAEANKKAAAADGAAPAEEAEEDAGWSLVDITKEAVGVVGENLAGLGGALLDPLGIEVGDLSDTAAAAEEQEVSVDSVSIMHQLFGTGFAAFCYLLMVLLYMPCGAAVAAVFREAGAVWTVFLACWTTLMGFSTSTIVYRLGTFSQDPMYAILSIVIAAVLLVGMVFWMRSYVKRARLNAPKVIPIAAQ
ncbi:Fe(2+) transporter permease subunit FeoB [Duodenibacillus massiliensis]|uniref:Fe(2+) transporter permease subunit FeoB n=2 Tax=Duodenibacillus massiliensis TaxID=1852381 RepID=UPI0030774B0B